MPAVKALTDSQGWRPEQIEHVYLSLGPGSFTGLRIAIAIARAMAQAIGCKIVGVPSLDVIAHNASKEFQFVVPLLDAKRGQVFAARYRRDDSGALARIADPALVDPAAFISETLALAQGAPIALLGEGLDYHRTAIASLTAPNLNELDRSLWPPRAETVHRLGWIAADNGHFSDPHTLLPTYIRLPEAEEVWRKKHGLSL
jgi:tRNA threonylcarbamoyladenosine biosynthesis protein TsaB